LPVGFEGLSLPDVAAKLGVGLHAVVPDFIRGAPPEALHHRGLGFYNHPEFPYVADFSAVEYEVTLSENQMRVVYRTGHGDLTTRCNYGHELLESGSSIPAMLEHPVKEAADYLSAADIFAKVRICPNPAGYAARRARLGEQGVAVVYLSLACGPMHHILRDLRDYEGFCLDLYDGTPELAACADALAPLYDGIIASALETDAEVALFGANYDDTLTYRPLFEQHLEPWLNLAGDRLHAKGKYLLTHTDGENRALLPVLSRCRFDIADSVCPAPMTRLPLKTYREAFADRITIWGGIPSQVMLANTCSFADFKTFVAGLLVDCRPYDRLILSIADTTPPDADFGRVLYLIEQCQRLSATSGEG
jgi:hypothetical protein